MNLLKSILAILILLSVFCTAQQKFTRELPNAGMLKLITPQNFPNMDAVIIVKEQSYHETAGEVSYYGIDIRNSTAITTRVLIVKLFNESAVKRYGSFEYEYAERLGDIAKNGFSAKARVLKPDGKVFDMPEDEVKIIVSDQDKKGKPLSRKAIFNVPDLAAGDVLQIEYTAVDPFSASNSAIFFHNDEDFVLFSNLYITLPAKGEYEFKSYPAETVGEPKVQQMSNNFGDGETYFWSLKNLNAMPSEPFSLPFADRSMITCFFRKKLKLVGDNGTWNSLSAGYFEGILDKGSVDSDDIELLGFKEEEEKVDQKLVDSLYTAIRRHFVIDPFNYPYPRLKGIDDLFEEKRGDASDLAFIMYKILEEWGFKARVVLVRDRREGVYEMEIPAMMWFDRIALLVQADGTEKLYDFDRSLPYKAENPWYLNKVNMPVIDEVICTHKQFSFPDKPENNTAAEFHRLKFTSGYAIEDSLGLAYSGSFAQRMRDKLYGRERSSINEYFRNLIKAGGINSPDSIRINNFSEVSTITASASGTSSFKAEAIDSFITVSISNAVLSAFRDRLFSTRRNNNIYFDSPLSFLMQYEIPIPEGYRLYQKPNDSKKIMQQGLSFSLKYAVEGNRILVTAKEDIINNVFPAQDYSEIIKHIDNSIKETTGELIFVKNKPEAGI